MSFGPDALGLLRALQANQPVVNVPAQAPIRALPGTYIQGPYATPLLPADEQKFQTWVKANRVPWQDSPTADYDMRGYYNALQSNDPNARQQLSGFDGTMHFPDTYKTPYHATFSNESQYATPSAPKWVGDKLVAADGSILADETPKPALSKAAAARIREKAK